jgi:hypothetical protein
MNRRGFLGGLASILAAGVAPAAVGSGILMPVRQLIAPTEGIVVMGWDMGHGDATDIWRCEVGRYDGVRMIRTPHEVRKAASAAHSKYMAQYMGRVTDESFMKHLLLANGFEVLK